MLRLPTFLLPLFHPLARVGHRLLSALWFVTRPKSVGAHAIALDAKGRLILVRLSYAEGWRLPGGGVKPTEDRAAAILRELEEEIGLTGYASLTVVSDFEHQPNFRADHSTLFLVSGVVSRFRPSLEVVEARAFPLDALPDDVAPITRRLLALWRDQPRDQARQPAATGDDVTSSAPRA